MATRKASNKVENEVGERIPWLVAGSADITDSTSVRLTFEGATDFQPEKRTGRQFHYGVREHEAAAISNGLSLSKLRPLWSTYLVFSDYARPAIRLSALMELPVIHVFTHDSIGLGEDGPTHQPVEHLPALRAIPSLDVIRPCDANEVAEAWRVAIDRHHQPVALILTRQNVPILDRSKYASAEGLSRGGYVLADAEGGDPELILIATGSEVALAIDAYEELSADGVRARVVSLPSWSIFDRQDEEYREVRVAERCHRPRLDRGGIDPGLGSLRRYCGADDRNAHVRLLGPAEGRAERVWIHAGEGRRDRPRSARGHERE